MIARRYRTLAAVLFAALWTFSIPAGPLHAQEEDVLDEEVEDVDEEAKTAELAKAAQNPLASLISVPVQNNTSFAIGEDPVSQTSNVMNIQPVLPFELSGSLHLITRTILPIVAAPQVGVIDPDDPKPIETTIWGLGDLLWTGWFVPSNTGVVMVGVGPALQFPTGTSEHTGSGKWGAGPSVVFVTTPGSALIGFLVNNIWSYAGDPDRGDVNQMLIQYFINYNLPKGWYLSSAPIITADWEAEDGRKWIVPFGAGGGRVFNIGKQPVNGQIQAFYNAVTPTDNEGQRVGPEWSLRLQFQLLFPKG